MRVTGGGAPSRARRRGGAAAHRLPAAQQLPPGAVAVAAGDRPRRVHRGAALAVVGRVRLPPAARDDGGRHGHRRVDGPARPPHRTVGPADARGRRGRGGPAVRGAEPGPTLDRRRPRGGRALAGSRRRSLVRAHLGRLRQQPRHRRRRRVHRRGGRGHQRSDPGVGFGHPRAEIPSGLWCYRVDSRRSLLGGALNDVGRGVSWLHDTVQLADADPDQLMTAAPEPTTPLVLPYLSGERSTGWAATARAVITGASTATTGAQLFRGAMEGVALSYQRIAERLRTTADPTRILASGRVTQDLPSWLQVLADVLGTPVEPVTLKRATLHGTALHALEVLAPDMPRAPVPTAATLNPVSAHREYYRDRAEQYDRLYRAV